MSPSPEQPTTTASRSEIELSVRNEAPKDNEDDDDVTVILLDHNDLHQSPDTMISMDWMEQQGPELEARRRAILVQELQRTQRISFCHFLLLCLVPAVLVGVVVAAAFRSGVDECFSTVTQCKLEERTFSNAFTTRCVCDPIPVVRSNE